MKVLNVLMLIELLYHFCVSLVSKYFNSIYVNNEGNDDIPLKKYSST